MLCRADDEGFASRRAVFEVARQQLGVNDSVEDLIDQYRLDYTQLLEPNEMILAAIRNLRSKGWRIGIVTNGPITQHEKIRRVGLQPLIDGCCVSDEYGVAKPDPRIFTEAIRRCCDELIPTDSVWMIGDSPSLDIAGGQGAGLRTIWLQNGREWAELAFTPDLIATDIFDACTQLVQADSHS
jgi:HAD superfamily hydrolase (TIGR01549 family)